MEKRKTGLTSQGVKCESCNSGHLSDFAALVLFILSPFRNFSSSFYELGILKAICQNMLKREEDGGGKNRRVGGMEEN